MLWITLLGGFGPSSAFCLRSETFDSYPLCSESRFWCAWLNEGSLAYLEPLPCNSFGFISFATYKRNVCNPCGNVHHKFVCEKHSWNADGLTHDGSYMWWCALFHWEAWKLSDAFFPVPHAFEVHQTTPAGAVAHLVDPNTFINYIWGTVALYGK